VIPSVLSPILSSRSRQNSEDS